MVVACGVAGSKDTSRSLFLDVFESTPAIVSLTISASVQMGVLTIGLIRGCR